ncbi:hypothetical protein NKH28_10925 [Mesorhizobium sp. M1227]
MFREADSILPGCIGRNRYGSFRNAAVESIEIHFRAERRIGAACKAPAES